MDITSAQYVKSTTLNSNSENTSIRAEINEQTWSVPISEDNTHYQAIQEWVAEGNTIEEAD